MPVKPLIAITMGDAAGIGTEVILKALASVSVYEACKPVVIGDLKAIQFYQDVLETPAKLKTISSVLQAKGLSGIIDVLDLDNLALADIVPGRLSPACGKAAVDYILKAAELAQQKTVDAVVTAPINKESTRLAGFEELGHMEILAKYTQTTKHATMLTSGSLRVVHLTTHHSLKEALAYVRAEPIFQQLKLTWESFRSWGFQKPRLAVAALNPHGGEGGILGKEEIEQIIPAVKQAQSQGIDASGPFPADTVFNRAIKGEFDAVLALYHDQGHIPIKVYGVDQSVSVALGLPFIRTSVDHGTAFDIAGKGIADARSMIEAIMVAANLSSRKSL